MGLFTTPSRSSPRSSKRGCLCKDGKYSVKCCDGSLQAQGIGSVTNPDPNQPFQIPYFWGLSDTYLTSNQIEVLINTNNCNIINAYPNGEINIVWSANGKYLWIAYQAIYLNKTSWYNTPINQGSIGGVNDLFGLPTQFPLILNNVNLTFKYYISNYATTTSGSMLLRE